MDVSNTCPRKIANVGVIEGVDVLVGESVGVEVMVGAISVDVSIVGVAAVGVEGGDDSTDAQEANIHVKQIPINNCFCIAYILLSIQRGINGLLKSGIRLSAFDQFSIDDECRCALDPCRLCIARILIHQIGVCARINTGVELIKI